MSSLLATVLTLVAAAPEIPAGLRCLRAAYPEQVCEVTPVAALLCDGTQIAWDDGRTKTLDEALADADLEDQMAQRYRPGPEYERPIPVDHDPGRIRNELFFKKIYGATREEVRSHLGAAVWLPRHAGARVALTQVNRVNERLQAVSDEVDRLPGAIRALVTKHSGTFVWRRVAGTAQLSMHSFALAIDVGVAHSDYWRWAKPDASGRYRYKNRIPWEVVEIFERHGFIWGGKWYHYDTMHFEYRPELLHPECALPR